MRKLTKILTPAIAVIGMAAVVPAPAMAASHDARFEQKDTRYSGKSNQSSQSSSIRSDIAALTGQIQRAERNRAISSREAQSLRRDAAQVKQLYASYARGGLNRSEIGTLSKRIDRIELALHDSARDNGRKDSKQVSSKQTNEKRDNDRRNGFSRDDDHRRG